MAKYITCGTIMSDVIEFADGTRGEFHLGGPALFALEGVRFFDKSCAMVGVTGYDWVEDYAPWLDKHGITRDTVRIIPDKEVSRCLIQHRPDGTYKWVPLQGIEHVSSMVYNWDDVEKALAPDTAAVYIPFGPDNEISSQIREAKKTREFKVMWELGLLVEDVEKDPGILKPAEVCDMFSINSNEASRLFGIPKEDDEAIIRELQKLPVEFTLYRCGSKGAFGVTKEGAWFCPSIDPTGRSEDPSGCGNCSTAASMYGWVETGDAATAAAIACVAAGYNAAQYGVWPHITDEDMAEAAELVKGLVQNSVKKLY